MEKNEQPKPLPPVLRKSVESGLITFSAVSENRRPETSVVESINFHFDTIGSATLRKGMTALGAGLTGNVLGLHYHIDTTNTPANTRPIVVNGTNAYYLAGASYVSIRTGLSAGSKARFCTFLNFAFMVNGTEATTVWDGTTGGAFVTTGNALNAPSGTFIEYFRGRVWIAGNNTLFGTETKLHPSRVYYSSVPSTVATPVVSWSANEVTGTQWFDVSASDGDFITALQRSRDNLVVFKTNRIYRIFDITQGQSTPYYNVGTSSAESVLESKVGLFFHHASGFYQYNVYGVVSEISRPIIDIVRAIPTSNYTSVVGWSHPDGDHLCWSIGNVTYKGITYTNMVVRYSISTQVWTHYTYPRTFTMAIRRQPFYTDGTTQFALTGDTAGNISEMDTGIDDMGTAIPFSLTHRWDQINDLLSTRKIIQTVNFLHTGGGGANIAYQTEAQEPDNLNDWRGSIGQLQTSNTGFNSAGIKGRKVRFRIFGTGGGSAGTSTGFLQPFQYSGYEIIGAMEEYLQFPRQ